MWPGDHGPARYGARPACTGSAGRATCALAVRWRSYQRDISSIATHAAEHPTKRDTRPAPQPHRSTIQANTVGDAAFTTSTGVAITPSRAPYPCAPKRASRP